jgi:hypothetical protein
LANVEKNQPNLKESVAVKIQLFSFGSMINEPLGQIRDIGNNRLYSTLLFGSH